MQTYKVENVNEAYYVMMRAAHQKGVKQNSRNGPVRSIPDPVSLVTESPLNCVLFDPNRDANPFFHLFEAMWMLAGRGDVHFPGRYVKRMYDYSDDGERLNGAYGLRWRRWFMVDQLTLAASRLQRNPDDRRVVIQMWDGYKDSMNFASKDVPCNLCMVPRIVEGSLDLTIMNRSNDIIWGMTGANAVHMSFVMQYLAHRIGCDLGKMTQVSTNAHVYEDVFQKHFYNMELNDLYDEGGIFSMPLMNAPNVFDIELANWIRNPGKSGDYKNMFFNSVLVPMHQAWEHAKEKEWELAYACIPAEVAIDWFIAGRAWIERRQAAHSIEVENDGQN